MVRISSRSCRSLTIEDLYVEADCYKTLLLHYHYLTSDQLEEVLANAKRDPRVKRMLEEKFGHLRKALDTLGVQASLEALESSPPPKDKQN